MSNQTPWQTVGPFFHYGLAWKGGADLVSVGTELGARVDLFGPAHYVMNSNVEPRGPVSGEPILLSGLVTDAEGAPIPDAMVEIWQANAAGRYADDQDLRVDLALDEGFIGFGRSATGEDGVFTFRTVKPGRVPGPGNSLQAPHIAVSVMGRGILKRLVTRIYFEGDPANAEDPILALVPAERRDTLMAQPVPQSAGGGWRFDIRLQGAGETVFFDL